MAMDKLKIKAGSVQPAFLNFCVYTEQILWYNTDTEKEIIIICTPKKPRGGNSRFFNRLIVIFSFFCLAICRYSKKPYLLRQKL